MSHVEFTYGGSSPAVLIADEDAAAHVENWLSLYLTGDSRGKDLPVARADGEHPLGRERSGLSAALYWIVRGHQTLAGAPTAGNPRVQMRHNLYDLTRWFDLAPGRRFTVTVDDADLGRLEGDAAHSLWSDEPNWEGTQVKVRQLIRVSFGVLLPEQT